MTLVFVLPLRPRSLRGVGTCPLIHSNYFSVYLGLVLGLRLGLGLGLGLEVGLVLELGWG